MLDSISEDEVFFFPWDLRASVSGKVWEWEGCVFLGAEQGAVHGKQASSQGVGRKWVFQSSLRALSQQKL